uniref:Adipocyte fatty acid binding protein n=1 Tax=Angiostrongylus cantonensis TaxID=6313 RepID=A0A0K0D830_ANGCA
MAREDMKLSNMIFLESKASKEITDGVVGTWKIVNCKFDA